MLPGMATDLESRLLYAKYPRRRLLHILGTSALDSMSVFALELIQMLPEYNHTVWMYDEPASLDMTLLMAMQAAGVNLLHVDKGGELNAAGFGAGIVYDVPYVDCYGNKPVIYYKYQNEPCFNPDIILTPNKSLDDHREYFMPPAIRTRIFGSVGNRKQWQSINVVDSFSIGIFSSGRADKYPADLIKYFMDNLPDDMRLIHTAIKGGPKPDKQKPNVWMVPLMLDAVLKGMAMSDVAIYAHGPDYTTKWGRLCFELLSTGKPVICERRGGPMQLLKDKVHTMFFETPAEAMELVKMLRQNPDVGEQLGANGRMLAGWQDIATHLGTLKTILRAVGT